MKIDFLKNTKYYVIGVDDAVLAAGITALSAGGQAIAQGKMNRKSIKFAREMYNKQRQDAIDNFNRINAYNTPEQQMRRFKEAGLNPHLIYGSGNATADAAPIASADVARPEMKTPDVGAILTGPVNSYMEQRSFRAQQDLVKAQTLKLLSETDNKNFDLSQKQRLADTQASILGEINTGKALDNWIKTHQEQRDQEAHEANMENLNYQTVKTIQEITQQTQRHQYDLLQRSQNLQKTAQEIVNLRIDETKKRLETKLANGEITRQMYEKETNKLDQMLKSKALNSKPEFKDANEALDWINSFLGIGKSLIK